MSSKQHVQLPNNMTVSEKLTPKDLLVYVTIKKYMNKDTLSCFPSLATIVETSGISKPTVIKAISKLEKEGYLKVGKQGRSNLYIFSRYKNFEPFSYEFLDREDLTPEEKAIIIAEQQFMFKDLEGYGKTTYSDLELSKKINMSYTSVVKHHKSLEKKGFLTTIKTSAKDSITGLEINEKIFHLNELGQAVIWALQKHEEDINELKEKADSTSKDVDIMMKELKRLREIVEGRDQKKSDDEIYLYD